MTAIATISQGGTGATTPDAAVAALGGLSRSLIGKPSGLLQADSRGYFPISILTEHGFSVGYALEGPSRLVHGETSTFFITNYNSLESPVISVDVGSVTVREDEFDITAPLTGSAVTLTLGERTITLPVVPFAPLKPEIVSPGNDGEVQETVTVITHPFESANELYGDWMEIHDNTTVHFPEKSVAIELRGRRGVSGVCYLSLEGSSYTCGISETRRKVERGQATQGTLVVSGTAALRCRFVFPSAKHIATDWEIAMDPDFKNLVAQSLYDTTHLTQWTVKLGLGAYYLRTRFYGESF